MSQYTKQLLFVIIAIFLVGLIGIWNADVQRLLGMFSLGWMMMDIARSVFPEK